MTVAIAFYQSNNRNFKSLYVRLVHRYWLEDFPSLLSYTRFLHKISALIIPICAHFQTVKGKPTGIALSTLQA
jgi:hypothetical protein